MPPRKASEAVKSLADLDEEFQHFQLANEQFQRATETRLDTIEATLKANSDTLKSNSEKTDKQHAELLALLAGHNRPQQVITQPQPSVSVQPQQVITQQQPPISVPLDYRFKGPQVSHSGQVSFQQGLQSFTTATVQPQVVLSKDGVGGGDGDPWKGWTGENSNTRPQPSVFSGSHRPFQPLGEDDGIRVTGDDSWGGGVSRASLQGGQPVDFRLRKLKMPMFDGTDAYGWVYKMERFFEVQGFGLPVERLRAAVLCLEGQALAWYRWSEGRERFGHWEMLKTRILDRFQPSLDGDLHEQFLAIRQDGTVRDYVSLFETLAAQVVGLPEAVMLGTFIKGLKPDIRSSVRLLQPRGLTHAIKVAILVDESRVGESLDVPKMGSQVATVGGATTKASVGGGTVGVVSGGGAGEVKPLVGVSVGPQFMRMTDAEYADKRAKGLCYRCDGKFGPGHKCPDKSLRCLQVLLVPEDDGAYDEPEDEDKVVSRFPP